MKVLAQRLLVLGLLIVLGSSLARAEANTYAIFSDENELLGKLTVERRAEESTTYIAVSSVIKVGKLIKVTVAYDLSSIFKKNKLFENKITTYRNDKLNSVMKTELSGGSYTFTKNGESHVYPKEIRFSESMMYFNEPLDRSSIYSEFDGVDKEVIYRKNNHYKLKNPLNEHVSEFFYKDGILHEAIVQHALITLHLRRILLTDH